MSSYLKIDSLTVQETKYNYECNYGGKVSLIKIHNTNLEKGTHGNIYTYLHLHVFYLKIKKENIFSFLPSVQSSLNEAMRSVYVGGMNNDEKSSVEATMWFSLHSLSLLL